MDLNALRQQYETEGIDAASLADEPIAQFGVWLGAAIDAGLPEPNAMTLSTIDHDGPDGRVVLLKDFDELGFSFFTNLESAKAHQMADCPRAALTFHWQPLHRQVRIRGAVEQVSAAEADAYFASRPRGSQIGAWASPQSEIMADQVALEAAVADAEARYAGSDVPRPPHWGGYRVRPDQVEFWQGQPSRLHHRVRYVLDGGSWRNERLAP